MTNGSQGSWDQSLGDRVDGVEVGVEEDPGAVALALDHAEHERRRATLDRVVLDGHPDLLAALGHPEVGGGVLADDAADADELLQQLLGALGADAGGDGTFARWPLGGVFPFVLGSA